MRIYYVYILKCSDGSYYVGVTNNIDRRLEEHNSGDLKGYTSTRLPVKLVYFDTFNDINVAIEFEKKFKGWSRAKKEALIDNDIERLKVLSRNSHENSTKINKLLKSVALRPCHRQI